MCPRAPWSRRHWGRVKSHLSHLNQRMHHIRSNAIISFSFLKFKFRAFTGHGLHKLQVGAIRWYRDFSALVTTFTVYPSPCFTQQLHYVALYIILKLYYFTICHRTIYKMRRDVQEHKPLNVRQQSRKANVSLISYTRRNWDNKLYTNRVVGKLAAYSLCRVFRKCAQNNAEVAGEIFLPHVAVFLQWKKITRKSRGMFAKRKISAFCIKTCCVSTIYIRVS